MGLQSDISFGNCITLITCVEQCLHFYSMSQCLQYSTMCTNITHVFYSVAVVVTIVCIKDNTSIGSLKTQVFNPKIASHWSHVSSNDFTFNIGVAIITLIVLNHVCNFTLTNFAYKNPSVSLKCLGHFPLLLSLYICDRIATDNVARGGEGFSHQVTYLHNTVQIRHNLE